MSIVDQIVKAAMASLDEARANPDDAENSREKRREAIKPYTKKTVDVPKLNDDGSLKSNK